MVEIVIENKHLKAEYSKLKSRYIREVTTLKVELDHTKLENNNLKQELYNQNANILLNYLQSVINWVEATFQTKKIMKGVDWGPMYNKYKNMQVDIAIRISFCTWYFRTINMYDAYCLWNIQKTSDRIREN